MDNVAAVTQQERSNNEYYALVFSNIQINIYRQIDDYSVPSMSSTVADYSLVDLTN